MSIGSAIEGSVLVHVDPSSVREKTLEQITLEHRLLLALLDHFSEEIYTFLGRGLPIQGERRVDAFLKSLDLDEL